MKKTAKKTKTKKAAGVIVPRHAQMPDFSAKKQPWPPKFTHISMIGFNNIPPNEIDEMGNPKPGHTKHTGFVLQWAAKGIGFGEYTFIQKGDGTMECDTECSSGKFSQALLAEWLKRVKFKA